MNDPVIYSEFMALIAQFAIIARRAELSIYWAMEIDKPLGDVLALEDAAAEARRCMNELIAICGRMRAP
ncbi:hypothetical protein WN982_00370 [Paraburkholderia sp. IMGN_8]|uniref:hypothetical protein n=1 Tax=Paraburkholderia sp. IMGN_8 TaxID=3136564 RepID=UPI003100C9C9